MNSRVKVFLPGFSSAVFLLFLWAATTGLTLFVLAGFCMSPRAFQRIGFRARLTENQWSVTCQNFSLSMMIDDLVSYHVHFPFCLFVYFFIIKKTKTLYNFFLNRIKLLKKFGWLLKVLFIELKDSSLLLLFLMNKEFIHVLTYCKSKFKIFIYLIQIRIIIQIQI